MDISIGYSLGGFQPPQTPWTWRSGARLPCHAGPIVAELPSKNRDKKENKRRHNEKDTIKKRKAKRKRTKQREKT